MRKKQLIVLMVVFAITTSIHLASPAASILCNCDDAGDCSPPKCNILNDPCCRTCGADPKDPCEFNLGLWGLCNLGDYYCLNDLVCVGGACKYSDGMSCTANSQCASGHCIDKYSGSGSVCCNSACISTCWICDTGTCTAQTSNDGKNCEDDCTYCNAGTCTDRAACANAECSSGDWCHAAGGNCVNPDFNHGQSETLCERACFGSYEHSFGGEGWGFEAGTPYCCGDDSGESYTTNIAGTDCPFPGSSSDDVCCNANNKCVQSDVCFSSGSTNGQLIPNKAYCNTGTWQGGDSGSTQCTTIAGSGRWSIGGETAATTCCGDDNSEYKRTRLTGTDAPWGPNSADDACCDLNSDCTTGDICYTSGVTSAHNIPNRAYCSSGTWYGGDYVSAGCTAIAGSGRWQIGGEASQGTDYCCGDDNSEHKITEHSSTDAPSGYNSGTTACCNPSTDCQNNDVCRTAGTDDGSAWCCSTAQESCTATYWYGADAYESACDDLVASGRWAIGGNIASTTCCGDDGSENSRTCQDGGAGACAESTDDEACCTDGNACVYDDTCYSQDEMTPNGAWRCDSGSWVSVGVDVAVDPSPASVTSTWQNTDATASVDCSTPTPSTNCVPGSYRLETYSSNPGSCSETYSDYTLSDPQTISSHVWVCAAAKDDLNNEGFSDPPMEFLVDQIDPVAYLGDLSGWTNQNSVTIDWNGTDTGDSGLNEFEIGYRITSVDGGTEYQAWAWWMNSSSNPGSQAFSGMVNNRTYYFRVRAWDNAGNAGSWSAVESISVDLIAPSCDIEDLPMYMLSSSFVVNWSGSDGESGIQYYNVQVKVGAGTWGYLNDPDGYHTTDTWDNVNGADGNTYYFRCNATDLAGNEWAWSAEKNTTVDATPPVSSVDALPEWINATSFNVSWSGFDIGSGIDCYDIQWDSGSGWNDWFSCTTILFDTFGPSSPVNVTENSTYSFRSRARDLAGHQENWPASADTNTTIDLTEPMYELKAYDQNGTEITGGYAPNLDSVTIRSRANDSISGIASNVIEYILVDEAGETSGSQDCGTGDPYGGISECNLTLDFTGGIMVEYWVTVTDRAGNVVISEHYHIGIHPLANFVRRSIYLIMGESSRAKIQVRNMQDDVDNVTINITSNLPVTPYFIIVDDPDVELTGPDNLSLIVKNLNPNQEKVFYVMIWSSDETSSYYMDLDAASELDVTLTDSDQVIVQIGYPAAFPGLDGWAILLLITLAVVAYAGIGIERKE